MNLLAKSLDDTEKVLIFAPELSVTHGRNGTAGSNPWSLIRKEKKTKPGVLHFGLSVVYRRPIQPPLTRWAGGHIATNRLQWSRPQSGFYDYEKALNSKDENRQKACVL